MRARWSLTKKLVGWGCIMALIVLALSGYSMYRLTMMQTASDNSYREAMIPLQACAQFVMALASVQSQINEHVATGETGRMTAIEAEIAAKLNAAEGLLAQLGSGKDIEEMRKQWESITGLIKEAIAQSKAFRKFEALNVVNTGEGLKTILELNKRISTLLTQTLQRAADYQKTSELLGSRTRKYMIVASAAALFLSVLIGLLLARSIGGPLRELSSVAARISDGDLSVEEVSVGRRSDEIGTLGESFKRMLMSLKAQSGKMREVVGDLSSVASELSTTSSELVQTASNTSSAVSEVAATVSQVSRAAEVASAKAKNVVDTSQEAMTISDSGSEATQKTVEKMNLIREQMESIGQTVVRLSEQSQSIEDIIVSVQDLADQSNLLAVNASIEAARAGDQGRGFAVVAQEIKTLADQSREATDQIRTILDDTRKWVSAVVMATEQGGKAVEAGVEQSVLAGDSIKSLVSSVANSAQAASVISASSEQQLSGMDGASQAMASIEKAMHQNLDGTSQVEQAAKKLEELGASLDELVQYYKL